MNQSSHWLCMVLMTMAVPVFAQEPEAVQVTLQDAIQRAVMVSPQIAQAEQNVVTANQSKRTAVGSFLPTISTGSGMSVRSTDPVSYTHLTLPTICSL